MTEPLDADYVVDRYGRAWYALGNGSRYWTNASGVLWSWDDVEWVVGPLESRNYEYGV